jgi:hypothetical protein
LASRPTACLTCGSPPLDSDRLWWARFHGARATRLARVERIEDLPLAAGEPRAPWSAGKVGEAARSVFFALVCMTLTVAILSRSADDQSLGAILILSLIGASGTVLCLRRAIQIVWTLRKDATAATFRRYTGPLRVENYGDGDPYWCLWVRDDRLHVSGQVAAVLGDLAWGSVDYTRHVRAVLRVRDEEGNVVWPPPDGGRSGPRAYSA